MSDDYDESEDHLEECTKLKAEVALLTAELEKRHSWSYEEMERLRAENQALGAEIEAPTLGVEVVRLRAQLASADKQIEAYEEALFNERAHVDRLKKGAAPPAVGPNLVVGDDDNLYELNIEATGVIPMMPGEKATAVPAPTVIVCRDCGEHITLNGSSSVVHKCPAAPNAPSAPSQTTARIEVERVKRGDGKAAELCECGHCVHSANLTTEGLCPCDGDGCSRCERGNKNDIDCFKAKGGE
jgi:cell division protein FtsB